jgi:hypothetical protein
VATNRKADSTARYSNWLNTLTPTELLSHRYRECTIIQPTWFMSRAVFDAAGGYPEHDMAEDLYFFFRFGWMDA